MTFQPPRVEPRRSACRPSRLLPAAHSSAEGRIGDVVQHEVSVQNSSHILDEATVDRIVAIHESPDGLFRLLVTKGISGDFTVGFENFQWHTHGSMLAGIYACSEEEGVRRFIADLASGKTVIAVLRRDNIIADVQIDESPEIQVECEPGETLELRYWDGSPYQSELSTGCRP